MRNPLSSQHKPSSSNRHLDTAGEEHDDIIETGQELTQRLTLTASTRAVLPSDNLSVWELLDQRLPTVSSVIPSINPEQCFSNHPPNESVTICLSRPVPPTHFVDGLRNFARQAMLNGKLSILDWTCKSSTTFFSFELIEFWSTLAKIIHAQQEWAAALRWLEQAIQNEPLDKEVREVHHILRTTPWNTELQILRSRVTFLEMVTFLSNGWLSSSQIDMALSSIATRQLQIAGGQERCHHLIGTTILSELLSSSPLLHSKNLPHDTLLPDAYTLHAPRDLRHAGAHLAQHGEVVFIAYSPPGHWAAISITSKGTLEWADSLGRRTPSTLITGVQKWLRYHLSSYSFTLGNNFPCSRQTDSYSCGIIALNAIRHRIFGDALWCEKNRSQLRIKEFIDIMHMCNQIGGQKVCFRIFRLSMRLRLTTFPYFRDLLLFLRTLSTLWTQCLNFLCVLSASHHPWIPLVPCLRFRL